MPIVIGVAGTPALFKNTEEALPWLAKEGFSDELAFTRNVWMNPERAKKFAETNKSYRVRLSIHAPYYVNLCNPEVLKDSMKRVLAACKIAEVIGAEPVVFHPGYYPKEKEEAYDLIKKACEKMAKQTSAVLGLETTGRTAQFGTLDETIKLCEEVKGCAPVVDFAHIYARNEGKIDFGEVLDKLKGFKHFHAHFSGIEWGNGGEKKHILISKRKPDFEELARLLKKRKTDITIVSEENPYPYKGALEMKKILEGV
jgi:deoxyribonuclease-4